MKKDKTSLVRVKNLKKYFGQTAVLRGISMRIEEKEALTLLGPNGAGKTTALKLITGLIEPDAGSIRVQGMPLPELADRKRARKIAFVPQAHERTVPYRVREFVAMSRYPYGSGKTYGDAPVQRALEETDLLELADRYIPTLSGGENQKVHLAAALAQEPDLLCLDEPTTFLDPGRKTDILRLLERIGNSRDMAILMVTHEINTALQISDRLLALQNGTLVKKGDPERFSDPDLLSKLYGNAFSPVHHPDGTGAGVFPQLQKRDE